MSDKCCENCCELCTYDKGFYCMPNGDFKKITNLEGICKYYQDCDMRSKQG